jgi:uncharacterized protein YprB with RNaseH-like and TPR domain
MKKSKQTKTTTTEKASFAATSRAKILYWDIETSDLSASFGELLCFGYWWHDDLEPQVINIYDFKGWQKLPVEQRDYYLLQKVVEIMEDADVLVGHYSTGFDYPFVQTRCLMHKMPPIPKPIQIDTWRIAKYQLALNSNKLANIAKALGCDEQKSSLPPYIWRRAKAHDLEALKLISEYNIQDVRTQRAITEKLMPLANGMPNWSLLVDSEQPRCSSCGSTNLNYRGYALTKLFKFRRLRCMDCGKWMRERNSITPRKALRYTNI